MKNTRDTFYKIYQDLVSYGRHAAPRGQKVLEIENYSYELQPYSRFTSFAERNLNLRYIKKEFMWYLKGQADDTSIIEHAKLWKKMVNPDGTINSNYGRYIFNELNQYDNVIDILKKDKESRKASIVILSSEHLKSSDYDTPCTYAINFRIRNDKLNMTVRMRSQDAIYGMSNDAVAFSFIHEMMLQSLREFYPALEYGIYHHSADSFHIYERHWQMLQNIITNPDFEDIECPRILNHQEVNFLRNDFLKTVDFSQIPDEYKFSRWLIS